MTNVEDAVVCASFRSRADRKMADRKMADRKMADREMAPGTSPRIAILRSSTSGIAERPPILRSLEAKSHFSVAKLKAIVAFQNFDGVRAEIQPDFAILVDDTTDVTLKRLPI